MTLNNTQSIIDSIECSLSSSEQYFGYMHL